MKARINQFVISFLSLTLLLPWTPAAWAAPITPEKEQELGRRFHLMISAGDVLMDDPTVNDYYRRISDRLMKGAGLEPDQNNFYVVNNQSLNAFTVPGGYFYVSAETIVNLENEGQLASLLAHEAAHLTSQHLVRRVESFPTMKTAYLTAILAATFIAYPGISDGFTSCVLPMSNSESTLLGMLNNSREDEDEADDKTRQYLIKAGYDTRDMYDAFRMMAEKTRKSYLGVPTYLSIHPALTSRLASTFKEYENSPLSPPDFKYQAFRDRVLALAGEPRQVLSVMTKRLNTDKNDHSALHALGLLATRQQKLTEADKLMNQALALEPDNREYLADLGDVALRRRQPAEAQKYFEKAGTDNRQAVLGLARASEHLGDKSQAATFYDRAVNMDTSPYLKALEPAGRFFSQNGQEAKGHYYLARFFTGRGEVKQAIFHYNETLKQPEAGEYKDLAHHELDVLIHLEAETKK